MLTERQIELFNNLMALVESNEAFFYVDQTLGNTTYRIFNYRLASYTDFLEADALECRGTTFALKNDGSPWYLASWPFEKFFNLHENPFTMEIDLTDPLSIQYKMDGSLISSFEDENGELRLKSKGSLFSQQAEDAFNLLSQGSYEYLHEFVRNWTKSGFTVIMEYMAPDNRIVIGVNEPSLTVLGVRGNANGKYVGYEHIREDILKKYFVHEIVNEVEDVNAFVESIKDMQGIEGFVIETKTGQRVKVKTDWYASLHHLKDSINSERRLFEAVIYETVDDLRANFYDDEQAMALINDMEQRVEHIYNHMADSVEKFYQANKHLDRKDYAIKGKEELDHLHFPLAMQLYSGYDVDYKTHMLKNRKKLGIKDEPVEEG